jgi:Fe-S-cluster containining protein
VHTALSSAILVAIMEIRTDRNECLLCGDCCRQGSPTLHHADLEILAREVISPKQLVTLRKGEPVYSPYEEKPVYLRQERIKIREKPGTRECIFLDAETSRCRIYPDRPVQCRAQACWDPDPAREIAAQPCLTRRELFCEVDLVLELLEEHDSRCSFDKLEGAFDRLHKSGGEEIAGVIDALAFEDHFREFVAERLNLPKDELELFFGRSFSAMVGLFGFRVEKKPDGTRLILPLEK